MDAEYNYSELLTIKSLIQNKYRALSDKGKQSLSGKELVNMYTKTNQKLIELETGIKNIQTN